MIPKSLRKQGSIQNKCIDFAEQGRVIFFKDKKNGNFNEMQKAVFSLFIEQIQFDFFVLPPCIM